MLGSDRLGPGTVLPCGCAADQDALQQGRDPCTIASERKYPEFIGGEQSLMGEAGPFPPLKTVSSAQTIT